TGAVDSFAYSEDDFRAEYASGTDYDIVRMSGQAGMANGGNRGIRAIDAVGTELAESFYLPGQVGHNLGANFGAPAHGTDAEFREIAAPTPGEIDPALLQPSEPAPVPETSTPSEGVAAEWPLVVTEIQPDNSGADLYEYFEVVNTTGEDISIGDDGHRLVYTYADSDDRSVDLAWGIAAGTVIPANDVVVFWLNYGSSTNLTDDQFRSYYGTTDDVDLVRATGLSGFANGGNRGIRIIGPDDATVGWSFSAAGTFSAGSGNEFSVPDVRGERAMPVHTTFASPTPGTVDPATLMSALIRPSDSDLVTATLQVTELMVNSANVGGGDAFEYIEVYNASDAPVNWTDYTIRYLYPLADLSNSSTTLWPSVPRAAEIVPGETIVLWVKNGANDALTEADFNAEFGTGFTLGNDLLELFVGGMANGAPRGIEIITNTEISQSRAYYNLAGAADVRENQAIHFASVSDDTALQAISSIGDPTPGSVGETQVPSTLKVVPADAVPPVIDNRTPSSFEPGEAIEFTAVVTDNAQVRTVSLELANDVDGDMGARNLVPGPDGLYRVSVTAVDTVGKTGFSYRLTASDGTQTADSGQLTVATAQAADDVRLSLRDGEYVAGTVVVSAAGEVHPPTIGITIDGAPFAAQPELEASPVFAFEATATDAYFRNGVRLVDSGEAGPILTVFDEGFYGDVVTVPSDIPLDRVNPGASLSVRVYAGTKAAPEIDLDENNDNYSITNLRMILPDGRTLRPAEGYAPDAYIALGDSGSASDFIEATFAVPDDAFTAIAGEWDTTTVADGVHRMAADSAAGNASADVIVDNTAPGIESTLEERLYQGEFMIDATARDSGAGLTAEGILATLDGASIDLPLATSSLRLDAAEHVVGFTATDLVGNTAIHEVRFTTPVEEPGNELLSPADGFETDDESVDLIARAVDPSGDRLDVTFGRGYELTPGDGVEVSTGSATDSLDIDRADALLLTQQQVEQLGAKDDDSVAVESDSKLPYQLFRVQVPSDAEDPTMRLRWDGSANAGAKILLYALDPVAAAWVELDRHLTTDGAPTEFSLEALVSVGDFAVNAEVTVLVQHSEGFAGDDLSTRESVVEANHPDDLPRSAYDFTIAWESDTQYYNASAEIYDRQLSIHDYLLRERGDINLQYLSHTGDIVDQSKDPAQWLRADPTYASLDDAGLPYGVLAGNHDVDQQTDDYTEFSEWFGEARYAGNPWYGGSHLDNRGHFDLITAGGIDFIMVYMGWAPGDEQIAWLNEVLAQYPERTAFLNLHEYMLTTGGLGPIPQRMYDEVIATNANVKFVSSGHYHDAFTRLDSFDDDSDGIAERTVTQMLFDYQGLPDGGGGYLRLLHFDTEAQKIMVRTYSDFLKDYNSDDPTLEPVHQEFEIPFAQAGIVPTGKVLATDAFRADVFSAEKIASFESLESGSEPTASWAPGLGERSWYVISTDPFGAVAYSEVRSINFVERMADPEVPIDPELPAIPGSGAPSTVAPAIPGDQFTGMLEGGISTPVVARPGQPIAIGVGADRAGAWVQVWLGDTALASWTQVAADGRVYAVISAGAAPGEVRLAVQDESGALIGWSMIAIAAEIAPAGIAGGRTAELAATGFDAPIALIAAAGALLLLAGGVMVARRRGERPADTR
ncbi:MAG: cell wall protein, partial [Burkholderiaceae bacterium]|nr:cell wall protein [Microbacteriaceae bacterium]